MNLAWLHIAVVHIPVLGTPVLLFIGIKALQSKTVSQLKLFYWGSLLVASFAVLAYFTGPATADWVKNVFSEYNQEFVENHALWGRLGFVSAVFSGLLGVMAISSYAQEDVPHKAIPWVLVIFQIINLGLFIYTAHLGGLIRRPDLF